MADIWRATHYVGSDEYTLSVTWDEESFVNGQPSIQVIVSARYGDGRPSRTLEATVSIVEGENGADILVEIDGRTIANMPLADLLDESQVIDRIPGWVYGAGDVVSGCLLRAGLSSVVGQIIRCKDTTRDLDWYRERLLGLGDCLRENKERIGRRTALRAARCILSAGF